LSLLALFAAAASCPAPASAFPLRVVAASELRVEPRLSSDQRTLTLALRLRDDRGAALAGRVVRVRLRAESFPFYAEAVRTDARGEATAQVELRERFRVFQVEADFEGDGGASAAAFTTRLDLDVPFVEAELVVSPSGFELGAGPSVVTVWVRVGEVVARSARALPVALVLDAARGGRTLAVGVTDGAGRAELRVAPEAFGRPGVHELVPRVEIGRGRTVDGAPRSVLVRARTVLGLARGPEDGLGVTLAARAEAVGAGPLRDAPVRLQVGERVLAGGRTDARGAVQFRVPWSALAQGSLSVRAMLDPTEPWLMESASVPVLLESPVAASVPWWWAVSAIAGALVALGLVALRERLRRVSPAPASVATKPPPREGLEREATGVSEALALRVIVTDRTTGAPLPEARCGVEGEGPLQPGETLGGVRPGHALTVRVEAAGYAPRRVPVQLGASGRYVLRVALRTWREEVFEVLRPLLRRRAAGGVLPTPREALRGHDAAHVVTLVQEVERHCYGPVAPAAVEVDQVLALQAGESGHAGESAPGQR
jgi:hypothetical protein